MKIDENPQKCDNHRGDNTTRTETIQTLDQLKLQLYNRSKFPVEFWGNVLQG